MVVEIASTFNKIGMKVLKQFPLLKVMCAPYSIPLGLINVSGIYNFDMCYDTNPLFSKSDSYDEETKNNTVWTPSTPMGISTPEITSATDVSLITQAVLNKLRKYVQITEINVTAKNNAKIIANYNEIENARKLSKLEYTKDGNRYAVFHCPPRVQQVTNIEVYDFTQMKDSDKQDIINDIEAEVTNELKKNGVDQGGLNLLMQNNVKMKAKLKMNMERIMLQSNQQNINISQSLTYIDRYGYCDNTGERSRGKLLKQTIDLKAISINIINSSTSLMMNNDMKVSSKTTVVVDKVQNYRIIFLSFIWNIVCVWLSFKLLTMIINRQG